MAIIIEEYNSQWPDLYEQEKNRIVDALGPLAQAIEHVGSTSVPGLGAKPIVDIMVGLPPESDLNVIIEPMQAIGFTYKPEYEAQMPYRRFFVKKPPDHEYSYNLHVVNYGCEFWVRHLVFRNYLRAHPEIALQYEQLKRELAPQFTNTNEYAEAKTAFIRAVEDIAGINEIIDT